MPFVGRIKAIDSVALRARVTGFLDKILFTEGQDVKQGDLLYQIEKVQYQAQVDQATANLAAAKAQEVNAQLTYNRSIELVKTSAGTQATVDTNRANLGCRPRQRPAVPGSPDAGHRKPRLYRYRGTGRRAHRAHHLYQGQPCRNDERRTCHHRQPGAHLRAVSGERAAARRDPRSPQATGRPLIKIEIIARLPSGKEYAHPGVWNYTDPQVDQTTDTVTMRATLPNPERQLLDGEFVTVEIRERKEQPRLVVPQAALQVDQAGNYVLVVGKDNKVELRRVKTGANQDTDVVIESGLAENEAVIVEGLQKVRPGQVVTANPVATSNGG